jgi:hypothetical protein
MPIDGSFRCFGRLEHFAAPEPSVRILGCSCQSRRCQVDSRQSDVVADVVGGAGDAVEQCATRHVISLRMPVDPAPASVATASDKGIDETPSYAGTARGRFDPQVFKVTDHPRAERVLMEHVVRKPTAMPSNSAAQYTSAPTA